MHLSSGNTCRCFFLSFSVLADATWFVYFFSCVILGILHLIILCVVSIARACLLKCPLSYSMICCGYVSGNNAQRYGGRAANTDSPHDETQQRARK